MIDCDAPRGWGELDEEDPAINSGKGRVMDSMDPRLQNGSAAHLVSEPTAARGACAEGVLAEAP